MMRRPLHRHCIIDGFCDTSHLAAGKRRVASSICVPMLGVICVGVTHFMFFQFHHILGGTSDAESKRVVQYYIGL